MSSCKNSLKPFKFYGCSHLFCFSKIHFPPVLFCYFQLIKSLSEIKSFILGINNTSRYEYRLLPHQHPKVSRPYYQTGHYKRGLILSTKFQCYPNLLPSLPHDLVHRSVGHLDCSFRRLNMASAKSHLVGRVSMQQYKLRTRVHENF